MGEKVKSIGQKYVNHLVTENGKLYLWHKPTGRTEMLVQLNSQPYEILSERPVEIILSDNSRNISNIMEAAFNVSSDIYVGWALGRTGPAARKTDVMMGIAITKDGKIVTWEIAYKMEDPTKLLQSVSIL